MAKIAVEYDTTRVNMNLPTKLVEKVKEYSKENGLPVTYGYVQLLNKGLDNDNVLKAIPMLYELNRELRSDENASNKNT